MTRLLDCGNCLAVIEVEQREYIKEMECPACGYASEECDFPDYQADPFTLRDWTIEYMNEVERKIEEIKETDTDGWDDNMLNDQDDRMFHWVVTLRQIKKTLKLNRG